MLVGGGVNASHITGGEMYYTFAGISDGRYVYNVTLKLFQRCGSGRQFPNPTIVSIFEKGTLVRIVDMNVNISGGETISITDPDPCITNPPAVCYEVAYYQFTVTLPPTPAGYVIASQVNFRIDGIENLSPGYRNIGATYTAEIPGMANIADAPENHSAVFTGSDLVIVCADNDFTYSFGAQDDDGDILRYSFCGAYASTSSSGGASPVTSAIFPIVPYNEPGYSSTSPLSSMVQINPETGLVSGVAPSAGQYVITVCVEEIRDGIVIAMQRKDVQINIADCSIAAASLLPEYLLCKNTQTITLANQSNSPLIVSTNWEFMDDLGNVIFATADPIATYTFPTIGLYRVKLVINRAAQCTDSTTSLIRVFPGFEPNFIFTGICLSKPTLFSDKTTSIHGSPNKWSWDFGEPTSGADISVQQNPAYTYPSMGNKVVRLIASDTRGCRDTILQTVLILDKPPLSLAFLDTLICVNDNLTLLAAGNGIFSWTPLVNIINPGTASPVVTPLTTTKYFVDLDDNGCKNRDSVLVRVVDFVTLVPMADTLICRTDTIQLRVSSDGLQYAWTPANQFIDPAQKNPFAFTNNAATKYFVTATIGGCSATNEIDVTTVPYPLVNAGENMGLCYNTSGVLNGTTDGNTWNWSPAIYTSNKTSLNTICFPPRTTDFILTAFDIKGCPKPGRDTVTVTVYPKMLVSAGRDTAVVIGQPLLLNAKGANSYIWSPGENLSAINIFNPIASFSNSDEDIRYKVTGLNEFGCRDSAFVNVKVFKTPPTIFVPTAFTPNNDGRNDLLRPIAVGIKTIQNFSIYNRWGQLVFTTSINGYGWDGKINGQVQSTNTFVWSAQATDYTGKIYFQKGIVTLIR